MRRPSQNTSHMQSLHTAVAAAQVSDRHDAATAARRARELAASRRRPDPVIDRIVLRPAVLSDGAAVAALAALDSAERPSGDLLIAELDGRIVAAVALDDGRAIADPFRLTADLVDLLRRRARQINAHNAPRRGRR